MGRTGSPPFDRPNQLTALFRLVGDVRPIVGIICKSGKPKREKGEVGVESARSNGFSTRDNYRMDTYGAEISEPYWQLKVRVPRGNWFWGDGTW